MSFFVAMYTAGLILTILLLAAYCLLILQYRSWFFRLPVFTPQEKLSPRTFFSIIVPARNEAANITACIESLLQQDYPADLYEIIVVNDHSTDDTAFIVQQLAQKNPSIRLINLADLLHHQNINSYKKKAIELAIAQSKGDWIVTTDADCLVQPVWLTLFDNHIQQTNHLFVAAPVMFTHESGFLSLFQLLDFLSLQGITAAAVSAWYHTMCNGANLAYQKKAFDAVGQFRGIDQLASGDDMLLMYKIQQQFPGKIGYLFHPKAIVTTAPMHSWRNFINQRIRWASKADRYDDKKVFGILLLVYAVNAALLILLFVNVFVAGEIAHWLSLMLVKTVVEWSFMLPVSRFYNRRNSLLYFPLMQPFHLFYTVIAGWLGKFGTYQWKGRKVH